MHSDDPKTAFASLGLGKRPAQKRSEKVAGAILEELSTLVVTKLSDPGLQGVAICRVEVTSDLSLARIFYTHPDHGSMGERIDAGLRRAKGFMRSHLARKLNLRFTPDLQFRYDATVEKVEELEKIFQEIADERDNREEGS